MGSGVVGLALTGIYLATANRFGLSLARKMVIAGEVGALGCFLGALCLSIHQISKQKQAKGG